MRQHGGRRDGAAGCGPRAGSGDLPLGRLVAHALPGGRTFGFLALSSPCFANCIFCGEETTRRYTFSDVHSVLRDIRGREFAADKALVAGWEPLSHPGVPEIVAELRASGFREVELMTTGIPLASARLAAALVGAGLTSVAVPLYSHVPRTNDLIMGREGAYDATVVALAMMRDAGVQIHVHALVLRQNLHDIDALLDFVRGRFGGAFVAAPARSKGRYADTAFRYGSIAAAVTRAPVVGAPLCLVPRMIDDPDLDLTRPLQHTHQALADVMRGYFMQDLTHDAACAGCSLRVACTGYVRAQREFEPDLRVVPRSSTT